MQNLFETFAAAFPADRGRPLMVTPEGDAFSYADADRESARIAGHLAALGLEPGDRVTVQAPKSPQLIWLYLACLRGGFVYQPLNDAYQADELRYFVTDAKPAAIVCAPSSRAIFEALIREPGDATTRRAILTLDERGQGSLMDASAGLTAEFESVDCEADGVAVLLYSSGTTGKPKGAMLTHQNLAANIGTLVDSWGFTAADRLLHVLPVYHAHGLIVAVGCVMLSGASMIFMPRFDARETLRHLPDATVMMGVPTFYTRLLNDPDFGREACTSARLFISGSAPLRSETHETFNARTGHAILERYGMTETCMNSSNPLAGERRPGSVGPPLPGIEIRVVDDGDRSLAPGTVGEIQIRGPNVFIGYWQMPEKTAAEFTADGFFRTGDQGLFSADGYLSIVGRNKDMIITGGLNVYPREVEQVIDTLPGVIESAVIGAPHPDFGEGVVAVVVPEPGQQLTESDLIQQVSARLAKFKVPKRVFFVTELPRNTMTKVEKNVLRKQYGEVLS
jgi:malonyl-CoA/methylmalonyl-CoA synthetase